MMKKFWEGNKMDVGESYGEKPVVILSETDFESVKPQLTAQANIHKQIILAKQPEKLKKFQEILEDDIKGFEFRCERWGDYLTLFVKRGPKIEYKDPYGRYNFGSNKIVSSINLSESKLINLTLGAAPSLSGKLAFVAGQKRDKTWILYDNQEPEYYYNYKIIEHIEDINPPNAYYGYQHSYNSGGKFVDVDIDTLAVPAMDDLIIFNGAKYCLHVPFGRGWTIYQQILEAIKQGTPLSAPEPTIT
jgi:hypothetical protein